MDRPLGLIREFDDFQLLGNKPTEETLPKLESNTRLFKQIKDILLHEVYFVQSVKILSFSFNQQVIHNKYFFKSCLKH
jgi:hypothetical protein